MAVPEDVSQESVAAFIGTVSDNAKSALQAFIGGAQGLRRVVRSEPISNLSDAIHAAYAWAIATELGLTSDAFTLDWWR